MLMYFGAMTIKSLATAVEFAETGSPIVSLVNSKVAKPTVGAENSKTPHQSSEELCRPVLHQGRNLQRIPSCLAVDDLRRGGNDDTQDGAEGEEDGEGEDVGPDDSAGILGVTCFKASKRCEDEGLQTTY